VQNPEKAAEIFSRESGFSINVSLQEAINIEWDSTITERDIDSFETKIQFLIDRESVEWFDINQFIWS
jgi:hypothetical protein